MSSYDIRIVSYVGKTENCLVEQRLFQVIAEGPNHATIAEATGSTIKKAFARLHEKLNRKLIMDSING